MKRLPSKILLNPISIKHLIPQNSIIIGNLVELYNLAEFPAQLKITCDRTDEDFSKESGTSAKYITYDTPDELFDAILVNSPLGVNLICDYE